MTEEIECIQIPDSPTGDCNEESTIFKYSKDNSHSCVVCYEPYEKVALTSTQAENIFRVLCKCLRVKSANTAFEDNGGSDFPLCECCSEFAVELVKLYRKSEAIREKIQEKIEEVIETIIESELARKEEILKIRESQLEDIKHDARVDSFRKQVIKSCEEIDASLDSSETDGESKYLVYDGADENKYADVFKNFRIKKEIFRTISSDTEDPVVDKDDMDVCVIEEDKDNVTHLSVADTSVEKQLFKRPNPFITSVSVEKTEVEHIDKVDASEKENTKEADLINSSASTEGSNDDIQKQTAEPKDTENTEFITLNYTNVVISAPAPDPKEDENSNETMAFAPPVAKRPHVTFERIIKRSPSDDEDESIIEPAAQNKDLPKLVPKENKTVERCTEKSLKKSSSNLAEIEYKDGKAFFQDVEIMIIARDESRVKCSLCKTATITTNRKSAVDKMRTHIIASHWGIYQCSICSTKCRDSLDLRKHMQSHSYIPEENFICNYCSHTCISRSGLKMHISRKHNQTDFQSTSNIITEAVLVSEKVSIPQQPFPDISNQLPIGKPKAGRSIKKRKAGAGRPKKSSTSKDKTLVSDKGDSSKQCATATHSGGYNKESDYETCDTNAHLSLMLVGKRKVGRPRKTPISPERKQSDNEDDVNETVEDKEKSNASLSISVPSSLAPVPYVALSFNINSDSDESDEHVKEFFDVNSSEKADPLRVEEESCVAKETVQPRITLKAPAVNPRSILKDILQTRKKLAAAVDDQRTPDNQPTRVDTVLTESSPNPNADNQDVIVLEDDDEDDADIMLKVATRTVILDPREFLQKLIAKSSSTTNSVIPFFTPKSTPIASHSKIVNGNYSVSPTVKNIPALAPIVHPINIAKQTSVPLIVNKSHQNPNPNPVPLAVRSLLAKQHMPNLEVLEARGLKVLEVVRNRSVDSVPVAVMSNTTSNKLRCGACGYENRYEYDNPAAALRAIKIHIYQTHFFTPGV